MQDKTVYIQFNTIFKERKIAIYKIMHRKNRSIPNVNNVISRQWNYKWLYNFHNKFYLLSPNSICFMLFFLGCDQFDTISLSNRFCTMIYTSKS